MSSLVQGATCHKRVFFNLFFNHSLTTSNKFSIAQLELLRHRLYIHCPLAPALICQQGQEVNRAGCSASSPLPVRDYCTWVTSRVSGRNACERPETDSAACLVFLNIAALPTYTQQFLLLHPPFSLWFF